MRALGARPIQLTVAVLASAMIAVALLLMSSGSTEASHGESTESAFEVLYTASVADTTPGADRELTTVLTIPFPNRINFGNLITFDPASAVTQTCNTAPGWTANDANPVQHTTHTGGGACLKSGDLVGTLSSLTDLATNNNPCGAASALTIDFDLFAIPTPSMKDSLGDAVADPRDSANIAYTQPEGAGSRFGRWSFTPETGLDFVAVGGGEAVSYQAGPLVVAEGNNILANGYPEYLLDLFDADGETNAGKPLVPLAVYGGLTKVAGTPVPLYFVVFSPGALPAEFNAPNPLGRATANMGFASQTVLNDPTPAVGNPSTVTAFCATEPTTILAATVGGISRAKNPTDTRCTSVVAPATTPGCTALNLIWASSQRDLDNDGIENSLDTCPFDTDVDGDPRPFGGDADGDNIDAACDPDGGGNAGDDVDSDSWPNQQDNCPLVNNPAQLQSELLLGIEPGYAAGYANDGGPLGDSLGDGCDASAPGRTPGPVAVTYNGLAETITPSDTIANGRWQVRAVVAPICYGGTDNDNDGYCEQDADIGFDGDATRWSSWTLTPALSAVLGVTDSASAGSWDTDGAGASGGLAFDSDWVETYLGIDARQPCSLSATGLDPDLPDEPLGAYVFDYNTDQFVDFGDILPVAPVFGGSALVPADNAAVPPEPAAVRFDWNVDGWVDFGDILGIAPAFGQACTPIVGPQ